MTSEEQWDSIAELPTKFNKYRRLKEKSEQLSQSVTSVNGVKEESSPFKVKLDSANNEAESKSSGVVYVARASHDDRTTTPFPVHLPPSYFAQLPLSISNASSLVEVEPMDVECEIPLNLTVPSSGRNRLKSPQHHNQGSPLSSGAENNGNNDSSISWSRQHTAGHDIHFVDDHFQRSLGSSMYAALQNRCSPPVSNRFTPNKSSPPVLFRGVDHSSNERVSVTGSVDDHFSKSLGDVWTRVKSSSTTEMSNGANLSLPTSVDDHFAKALGETWVKIQAGKNCQRGESVSARPQQAESPRRLSKVSFPR